jgi:separase
LNFAQESIEIEQEVLSREDCLKWPESGSVTSPLSSLQEFRKDYVDIIPESWTAVSLALNDEQNELYITRYESKQEPFVLRLPMARHSSRDADEDEFTFTDGKHEFEEIIELSDFSTRSAKEMTTREARAQWWTEREALDTKLHELLINIENIWLGGFKGIFSHHAHDPELLSRFQTSLQNILNRHLPSRRKRGQQKELKLNPKVLELFIGLGDDSKEEGSLDDALADLIYFVVDILQFNGERNAYDEIDFDAMVIETLDALRAYHSASQNVSPVNKHMILILDKNLHMLPWESLPYLENLSISRLPSLAALRERLLAAQPSSETSNALPGHYVRAEAGGTSILNPSGDLSHTLKTIKPRLDGMRGRWNHIISRAPTEKEFEESLRDTELVLYFGHGSGAQFVRSKSVRRLYLGNESEDGKEKKKEKKPGCATTFLFGCSSVHLSDNGIYEPSGMLASYLTAGAPAVVGMLWDVTDKDCDRFAVKAGELWGLWPEPQADSEPPPPPTVKKSKSKSRVAQLAADDVETVRAASGNGGRRGRKKDATSVADEMPAGRSGGGQRGRSCRGAPRVGLDEAVTRARKECVLRYLNGAAAVVYGIPVYLE